MEWETVLAYPSCARAQSELGATMAAICEKKYLEIY